jgi:uncharacterized protein (TIGR02453 family)
MKASMKTPRFSKNTIQFLKKAARQKGQTWLEKNREEYEEVLLAPLQHLARELKRELGPLAPDYNFPQKGIGRLKYSSHRAKEKGGRLYKGWMTYSAARPRQSRFEHNPNLFFLINTHDPKDTVLVAGGLYMPSSRQMRALRETIARDASAFDRLFATKDFARCFPEGFSLEKSSTRVPRGFDPAHPRMDWIKLQAFFVWHPYKLSEFTSPGFARLVARDFKQVLRLNRLRLNRLLEKAVQGQLPTAEPAPKAKKSGLLQRLESVEPVRREMDF